MWRTLKQRVSESTRLWRYYQAAILNTAFGYGLFALFIAIGMNMYVAQIFAHILGVSFNYFTYSKHAFRNTGGSKVKFILAYVVNYLLGLVTLKIVSLAIASPYLAGFITLIIVSLINYVVLSNLVFTNNRPASS